MIRVLIVEDNLDLRSFLSGILLMHNYQVRSTSSKSGLCSYLQNFDPEIILLDVVLGEDDGRDICKAVKAKYKSVAIMLMSANPALLANYTEHDADDIIEKPFDNNHLLHKVKSLLPVKKLQ